MNLTTLFVTITALIASVCIKFDKLIYLCLYYVCKYIEDDKLYPFGPYMKSKPIRISYVLINNLHYTNKMELLMNWKWNFDIGGITCDDILTIHPNPEIVIIKYTIKNIEHECNISITDNTYKIDLESKDILFGEICLDKVL